MCSATWPHAGPGFNPGAIDPSKCSNINNPSNGPLKASLANFLPASNAVSDLPVEYDSSDDEFEVSSPEVDNCEEEDLTSKLDSEAENWYDGLSESWQTHLWKWQYCRLSSSDYRELYTDFINGDEEYETDDSQLASSWRGVITDPAIGYLSIQEALEYLTNEDASFADDETLLEVHDVKRFMTASNVNAGDPTPSHREPGIVTRIEIQEEETFVRIYGQDEEDDINGRWVAPPTSVTGMDRESIIDDFALWDDSIAGEDSWGDYHCVAKMVVPDDNRNILVSRAGPYFEEDYSEINETVPGGVTQIHLEDPVNYKGYWMPLGRINNVFDGDTYEDRFEDLDEADPDDEYVSGPCAEDIYNGYATNSPPV